MSRSYNIIIIDADGHVLKPPDFWQDYLDPAYRDAVVLSPRLDTGKISSLTQGEGV